MAIKHFAVALPTEPLIFRPGESWQHDRIVSSDWRQMLPVLHGAGFHLRELRRSDAASLFSMLTTEEVARFACPRAWRAGKASPAAGCTRSFGPWSLGDGSRRAGLQPRHSVSNKRARGTVRWCLRGAVAAGETAAALFFYGIFTSP